MDVELEYVNCEPSPGRFRVNRFSLLQEFDKWFEYQLETARLHVYEGWFKVWCCGCSIVS